MFGAKIVLIMKRQMFAEIKLKQKKSFEGRCKKLENRD